MLTPKQLAEKLAVSTSAVYSMLEAGKIEHHRVCCGKRIRISEEALADYLQRTKVAVPQVCDVPDDRPARRSPRPGYSFLRAAGWDG